MNISDDDDDGWDAVCGLTIMAGSMHSLTTSCRALIHWLIFLLPLLLILLLIVTRLAARPFLSFFCRNSWSSDPFFSSFLLSPEPSRREQTNRLYVTALYVPCFFWVRSFPFASPRVFRCPQEDT